MTTAITADARTEFGRRASASYRKQGKIPAVIMRSGAESDHIVVDAIAANQLLKSKVHTCAITVDGKDHMVLIRDADRNCLDDSLVHIDFLEVDPDKTVMVEVPLRPITLNCPGIKAGGLLEQMARKVKLRCPVRDIPNDIPVDLEGVGIAETVYAENLKLADNHTLLTPPRTALMSVLKTRAMKKAEAGK